MNLTSPASLSYPAARPAAALNDLAGSKNIAAAMPLVLDFEANWRARTVLIRALGAAILLSASGLWLFPGETSDPELSLMKVGVSVLFFVLGLVLLTVRDPRGQPEACFDPVRRELRILRMDSRGHPKTVLRRGYDTLGGARLTAGAVELYENDGSLLIEVPLGSAAARSQLRDQLSGAVQLFN
ncbi:hypothetical protein [Pseudophaeobacter sp.]|uniref:hypothetical protein n=1 Tax=Pseudophaeobacter sp. TaxID=1971739 RepID=UPI00329A09CA